jgi:hypothetical protein
LRIHSGVEQATMNERLRERKVTNRKLQTPSSKRQKTPNFQR